MMLHPGRGFKCVRLNRKQKRHPKMTLLFSFDHKMCRSMAKPKKLAVTAKRCEHACKRTAGRSVAFCGKGGTAA
ncbi:MAG: hypothetical protein DBX63_03955 [Clostridia bacterium]|nr:MAG: hypothetical protein DBX63_03955 [Clostridia bacterium]